MGKVTTRLDNGIVMKRKKKITKKTKKKVKKKTNITKKLFCRFENCEKFFTDNSYRRVHEKIHMNESHPCPECPHVAKTRKYLTTHIRVVHTNASKRRVCEICGKSLNCNANMKEHMMIHTGEKPHKCKFCDKTFRVTYTLQCHMRVHTNEKPFECVFCDYSCRDSSTLRKHQDRHMGTVRMYSCNVCPKQYDSKAKLKFHIADVHMEIDLRKFQCTICNKLYKSKERLHIHKRTVHTFKTQRKCTICDRVLKNKSNLIVHMRSHIDLRPFICTFDGCTAKFKDRGALKKHTVIHYPEKQFPCEICDKLFARSRRRDRHVEVMHTERVKNVECDYCGVKFYTKNYLIKHINQKHSKNRKKYICDICNLVTYNKPSIVMHLKYGHQANEDLKCKICKHMTYKTMATLKSHYLNSHNVQYKIDPRRSAVCRRSKRKKETTTTTTTKTTTTVEIKVEQIDENSQQLLLPVEKIEKEEVEECSEEPTDTDFMTYSERVLSEDLYSMTESMVDDKNVDDNFEQFFKTQIIKEQKKKHEDDESNFDVDIKKMNLMTKKINGLVKKMEKLEKKKKKREQKKMEEKERQKKEREEIDELKKVWDFCNERIRAANSKKNEKQKSKDCPKDKTTIKIDIKNEEVVRHKEKLVFDDGENDTTTDDGMTNDDDMKINIVNAISLADAECEMSIKSLQNEKPSNNDDKSSEYRNDSKKSANKSSMNDSESQNSNNEISNKDNVGQKNDGNYQKGDKTDATDNNSQENENGGSKNDRKLQDDENDGSNDDENENDDDSDFVPLSRPYKAAKNKYLNFKTNQCYICFKLFPDKSQLNKHTLTHLPEKSKSVININHSASREIDKRNRELKNKTMAKNRLVKTGKEWIVESVPLNVNLLELPVFTEDDYAKIPVTGTYVDRLGQLHKLAKKRGVNIMFPCKDCEKICQNLSALKLHSRRHDPNKKPFAPRRRREDREAEKRQKSAKINYLHRTAKPKPIVNKHKCDEALKNFYKTHIRGADIEFWQFLKTFNKMDRDNINDFKDFEGKVEYGVHHRDEALFNSTPNVGNNTENVNIKQNSDIHKKVYKSTVKNVNNSSTIKNLITTQNRKFTSTPKIYNFNERNKITLNNRTDFSSKEMKYSDKKYKRMILLTKKEHLERQAKIMELREKIINDFK